MLDSFAQCLVGIHLQEYKTIPTQYIERINPSPLGIIGSLTKMSGFNHRLPICSEHNEKVTPIYSR